MVLEDSLGLMDRCILESLRTITSMEKVFISKEKLLSEFNLKF